MSTAAMHEPDRDRSRRGSSTRSTARADRSGNLVADASAPLAEGAAGHRDILEDWTAYKQDVWERSILFWDTLRRRADNMLEHERQGMPPLLDFKAETLLDARGFERPSNYALLRIAEAEGVCASDCVEPSKPPVIVVDPRAGHGPGIGGFKRDSEVGMALKEGHPVYFVIFFPEPCEGQTLADVLHALRRFLEHVAAAHPGQPPILYGNCQAGWAITLLSADCQGLAGPVVLNGSPLSYWGGESGFNPMRLAGGMLGGAWLAHLLADVGDGRFDGAWLVQNFENLKPGNALWDKYATLFTHPDRERDRFLAFERWWGGFYFLSREEIVAIVENLFIGNQLEQGLLRICHGCTVDLKRIRNPLVIFASYGDNITPPHQALGWIPVVYKTTEELEQAGQRIVYLTNPHVGHLGIFVSADVARHEHRAILNSIGDIEALAPGLYEMTIEPGSADPACSTSPYTARFERRRVEDIPFIYPREAFERVRQLSELGAALYESFIGPWIRAASNPWTAEAARWLHPMRTSRHVWATAFNPWMQLLAPAAQVVEASRHAIDDGNLFIRHELTAFDAVSKWLDVARSMRDAATELLFAAGYGALPRDEDRSARRGGIAARAPSAEAI